MTAPTCVDPNNSIRWSGPTSKNLLDIAMF